MLQDLEACETITTIRYLCRHFPISMAPNAIAQSIQCYANECKSTIPNRAMHRNPFPAYQNDM